MVPERNWLVIALRTWVWAHHTTPRRRPAALVHWRDQFSTRLFPMLQKQMTASSRNSDLSMRKFLHQASNGRFRECCQAAPAPAERQVWPGFDVPDVKLS